MVSFQRIGVIFDNCNPRNTLMKHNNSKSHRGEAIGSKTPASSVIAQMDASDSSTPQKVGIQIKSVLKDS